MATKEQLVENVKQWLEYDVEIARMQKEIKTMKEKRKNMSDALMGIMKEHEIGSLDIKGGSIIYKQNKSKKPITAKNLVTILQHYDTEKADEIAKFILENREEQVKDVIKRKAHK